MFLLHHAHCSHDPAGDISIEALDREEKRTRKPWWGWDAEIACVGAWWYVEASTNQLTSRHESDHTDQWWATWSSPTGWNRLWIDARRQINKHFSSCFMRVIRTEHNSIKRHTNYIYYLHLYQMSHQRSVQLILSVLNFLRTLNFKWSNILQPLWASGRGLRKSGKLNWF